VRATRTLALAFAGMGAHAAVVPAVLPVWSQAAGEGVLAAVPAMFAGLVVGVLASVPLLTRFGAGRVLRGSTAAQACALAALAAVAWAMGPGTAVLAVTVAAASGVAFGVTESATSVAARAAVGTDRRLGRLLAVSAATAAVLPVLVFAATRAGVAPTALLVAALAPLLVALRPAVASVGPPTPRPARARPPRTPGLARVLVPAAVALALYVGVETLLSGWSAVLTHDLLGADPALAALGASVFWLLMSAGRAWGARTRGGITLRALLAAALFALAAVGGRVPTGVAAACAATVLVVAPAYPRLLGAALDRLDGPASARWTGPLVAAGAAGGSLLPALALRLGPPSGAATFVSAAAACLALALVAGALTRPSHPAPDLPAVPDALPAADLRSASEPHPAADPRSASDPRPAPDA